jgi:hypothetical protein
MAEKPKRIHSVSPEDSNRIIIDAERITTLDIFHRERMTVEQYHHPDPGLRTLLEVYYFTPSTRDPDITAYLDNILKRKTAPELGADRHRCSRNGDSPHPNLYAFITTAQALIFSRWQELDDSPKKREVIIQGVMHEIFMHRNGVTNEHFKVQLGRLLMRELGKDIGW